MTTKPTKTELKNYIKLRVFFFFFFNKCGKISIHLVCGRTILELTTRRGGFKVQKEKGKLIIMVHVLHKTLTVVISCCCFAEDDKETYQSV